MRIAMFFSLILLPVLLFSSFSITEANKININNIQFDLKPDVMIKTGENLYQKINFTSENAENSGTYEIIYSNEKLDLTVRMQPINSLLSQSRQVQVTALYKQNLIIRDIALDLIFNPASQITYLRGPQAISSGNKSDNINLYPYTDKIIEYKVDSSSFWIAGSNYTGCEGIEKILNNSIRLYDHTLHLARLYSPPNSSDRLIDTMPRNTGQTDSWSFLIFETKPYVLSINRWPGEKKAALAITNDADGENISKLKAVYLGSNNPNSPSYLTKGLIANQIPISNTVFGTNITYLEELWYTIKEAGSAIGYHTYSEYSDPTNVIAQSLLNSMSGYDVRLWIDHAHNYEDLSMMGNWAGSSYYITDVINQSDIDYAWIYDTPVTNPLNAFEDPWRLPHKLHYFENFTRPVWFFGRTRMETWEFFNEYYMLDFKHAITAVNLDNLIQANGLCIVYTHLCFDNISYRYGFHTLMPNGDYEIRDEFNDVLIMLNDFQTNKGLWIDTVENIFDRMLAIEQVQIINVENDLCPGFIRITLENKSGYDIQDLLCYYRDYPYLISSLNANSKQTFLIRQNSSDSPAVVYPYLIDYRENSIFLRSKASTTLPPFKVDIYNVKGQLVKSYYNYYASNYAVIPFEGKPSGIYFARIKSPDEKTRTARFQVIK